MSDDHTPRATIIGDPHGYLASTDQGLRVMRQTAFLRLIGGMKEHHRLKAAGAIDYVHHLRYDRDGAQRRDVDVIGRDRLWINFATLVALGLADEGVTNGDVIRLFSYRNDADAALSDLRQFTTAIRTAQRALSY